MANPECSGKLKRVLREANVALAANRLAHFGQPSRRSKPTILERSTVSGSLARRGAVLSTSTQIAARGPAVVPHGRHRAARNA
jgi:hypothetical protein